MDKSPENSRDRKWTLVVNDVDRYHPPLSDWMEETFSFLPRWRRDDGQVSLAHAGGGIGPHVDNYDVFLIQVSGKRVWEIGCDLVSVEHEMDSLVEGIDVRILRDWEEVRDRGGAVQVELSPGDILYLPPRFAHCGTALSNSCMTLSVGCRAPSASDILSCMAQRISETLTGCSVRRYEDPDLLDQFVEASDNLTTPPFKPGHITDEAKAQMKKLVKDAVNEIVDDDNLWDELIGKLVTESNRPRDNYPVPILLPDGTPFDEDWNNSLGVWGDARLAVETVLGGSGALYHAEGVAFSFSSVLDERSLKTHHRLFANGEMFEIVSDANNELYSLSCICDKRRLTRESLSSSSEHASAQMPPIEVIQVLEILVSNGLLYGSDE